jgi:Transposase DDE domain
MNNRDIEWHGKKLEQLRGEIESGQLNALRGLLPDEVILQICEDCGYDFRARLLTPLATIFHMLGAGISREGSFQSAWHMSGQVGRSGVLSDARQRLPLDVWTGLHEWMNREIERESGEQDRWRGHRMIGLDGTLVSMSDEPELAEHFGRWGSKYGASRFPQARIVVAFNLKSMVNIAHEADRCRASEKELGRKVLARLKTGDVVVFDRLYSGANLYAEYQRSEIEFIGRAHACLKVERLKTVESFSPEDKVVELPIDPRYLREDSSLPKTIVVRMIQTTAKMEGRRESFWIVTSLLDPKKYPAAEVVSWQKKRWKIETLIEEMKLWLGVDILRSKSTEGICKEIYARIMGLNLIHWLILKAARKYRQEPDRLSVSSALRLAASYSLKMSTAPAWQLRLLYEQLLERIARAKVTYRPDRLEPRMKKREPRNYPRLKITRSEWRLANAMCR